MSRLLKISPPIASIMSVEDRRRSTGRLYFEALKRTLAIVTLFYALLVIERLLVHFPRGSMNMDSLFYTLSAIRFAEGNFTETFSGPWQPLTGWLAGLLVFLGFSATSAVTTLCILGGAAAIGAAMRLSHREIGKEKGVLAALATGLCLSNDPQFLHEVVAVRSDGLHVGISFSLFLLLHHHITQSRKATLRDYAWLALFASTLVALRVAALPTVLLATTIVVFFVKADRAPRMLGIGLYLVSVLSVLLAFSLFYYHRFGLFLPSLNFALNRFLMVVEWMKIDLEGFCRLYDGHNTFLADLQFLDPAARKLPDIPWVAADLARRYRWENFLQFFKIAFRIVSPIVWMGAIAGAWILWKAKRYRFLIFASVWAAFACGAQAMSTVQYRFFVPILPLVYVLFGIGISGILKSRTQWLCVLVALINIWNGRHDMNPGFLLSGKFLNAPELVGEHVYRNYGPGKIVMAAGNYPSLIAARARWKTIPCVETSEILGYLLRKRVDFLILTKPLPEHQGPTILRLLSIPGLLALEVETESEALYRVNRSYSGDGVD